MKEKQFNHRRRRGFSLIEVTLALVVVGVGFAALLSFLPHGLRASRMTTEESAQSSFAVAVFGAVRAQAMEQETLAQWNNWTSQNQFKDLFKTLGLNLDVALWNGSDWNNNDRASNLSAGSEDAPEFGVKSYYIRTQKSDDGLTYMVSLWSTSLDTQKALLVRDKGMCYYAEFKYRGLKEAP